MPRIKRGVRRTWQYTDWSTVPFFCCAAGDTTKPPFHLLMSKVILLQRRRSLTYTLALHETPCCVGCRQIVTLDLVSRHERAALQPAQQQAHQQPTHRVSTCMEAMVRAFHTMQPDATLREFQRLRCSTQNCQSQEAPSKEGQTALTEEHMWVSSDTLLRTHTDFDMPSWHRAVPVAPPP